MRECVCVQLRRFKFYFSSLALNRRDNRETKERFFFLSLFLQQPQYAVEAQLEATNLENDEVNHWQLASHLL